MNTLVAGERFNFHDRTGNGELPKAWRQLDHAIWRWTLAHGGSDVTARAAGWASQYDGRSHAALPLVIAAEDPGQPLFTDAERTALASDPLVATDPGDVSNRPFVLDHDHFYLLRNYRDEVAVARALCERRAAAQPPRRPLTDADLHALFNGIDRPEEARQRDAVRQSLGRRLMVLTGGPGTGKTTTVLRMLLALSREHAAASGQLPRLALAAPTGKAAQRLGESLRQGAVRLHDTLQGRPSDDDWVPHLQAVQSVNPATVHRLLGGHHDRFVFHAGNRLPADIVVIDEASMLDLGLLHALLDALLPDAVLVLVGDADQLTSVATGSVLMDLVTAMEATGGGDLVRLAHCFRADATLVPVLASVRSGDGDAFDAAWAQASAMPTASAEMTPAAVRHPVIDAAQLHRHLRHWADDLWRLMDASGITEPAVDEDIPAQQQRLALLKRMQLLCALRDGPFGALQAAARIAAQLRRQPALSAWQDGDWYPGRCVMITRNDAAAGLYNGDIGLCLPIARGAGGVTLQVAFETATDATGAPSVRRFDPATLPAHEDAFAITIHKSQGSEYDRVAVLLPTDEASPLLARQTLYTGLSRARRRVELWGSETAARHAIANPLRRHGRLAERLQGPPPC